MDKIWVKNYRCFREKREVPLTSLTLLVGENSTGKSSLLAMINALISQGARVGGSPNFKEPYDLGSFDDIVHNRGGQENKPEEFASGFESHQPGIEGSSYSFDVYFRKHLGSPFVARTRTEHAGFWVEAGAGELPITPVTTEPFSDLSFTGKGECGSSTGSWEGVWKYQVKDGQLGLNITRSSGSQDLAENDFGVIAGLTPFQSEVLRQNNPLFPRVIPSAPVRSNAKRSYDLARVVHDPEGSSTPSLFAHMFVHAPEEWGRLKEKLEGFGKESGLFEEITVVRSNPEDDGAPFQIRVRISNNGQEGPWINLADVGYGVSQILPTASDLFNTSEDALFLLQQPETHLHPSAEAALGTQLCRTASEEGKQIIVETHSDYLVDRVRMDVRDQKTSLTYDDVTLLYFERNGMDVRIWPIKFDERGDMIDPPDSYRRFFMREVHRSVIG